MPIRFSKPRRARITNRVGPLLLHASWYATAGQQRLAQDCNVSCSTISRLARNHTTPSYDLAQAVTAALSRRLERDLDMREVFTSEDGVFPTPCVCDLTRDCRGCYPPGALGEDGQLKPPFHRQRPGDWCRARPLTTPAHHRGSA